MTTVVLPIFLFIGTIVYILCGVVGFLFLERRLSALVEHRSGHEFSLRALMATFMGEKKTAHSNADTSRTMSLIFYFWLLLPVLFIFFLFGASILSDTVASLPALFLVALFSLVLEVVFVHYCTDALEREGWRSRLAFRFAGVSALAVTFWVVALNSGNLSLWQISLWQEKLLFPLFLSSPGALLSALMAFLVISALTRFDLQEQEKANHLRGRWQRYISLNKRAWLIGFSSLWVFCFFGSGTGFLATGSFPIKVAALLLLLICLQISLPAIRSTDLTESFFGVLLKVTMLGILMEIAWIGLSL